MEFTPQFFDEASKAWRANKVRIGESFRYKRNAFPVTVKKEVKEPVKGPRRSPRLSSQTLTT
jgi:hypothetical protein